jgi:uncharacterized protein (DUF2235 family)
MGKNVVLCLDGTNNKVRAAANTNVVRMFDLLNLSDPAKQVAYYQPGVGTFSSAAAWTPPARTLSRYLGLAFGAGLRQNLGDAYRYLMAVHEPGDQIFIFGFSRGAYTARALTGMLEVFGLLRRGSENLIPYAVAEYARQDKHGDDQKKYWDVLREYARVFGRDIGGRKDHLVVHFLGIWDTVKAAGNLTRQLRWPYTVHLPHVEVIRHAIAVDEKRRPYAPYPVGGPLDEHLIHTSQDLQQVWFAGVHSDVGGMFEAGAHLSDIPLKWMAQNAVKAGLIVRDRAYADVQQVSEVDATGSIHKMGVAWVLLGRNRRRVPQGASVHASVANRVRVDPSYAKRIPRDAVYVDNDWLTSGT